MKAAFVLGRLIFGGYFLFNGINHFVHRKELAQYAGAKNVPMPEAAVVGSGIALTAGGLSLLLGLKPKLGSLAILGFLASVTPAMHDFWSEQEPGARTQQELHFGKNLALLGAAAALMSVKEPWPVSVPIAQPSMLERIRDLARRPFAA